MKVGTKSILFGVHSFWFHPITVLLAWIKLYGRPSWKEFVCIVVHDWGYYGKPNMDGREGEMHPVVGAEIAHALLDPFNTFQYRDMCLYHSRTCAKKFGASPSKLCWADKLSINYDPWWFYLTRATLSGEIHEYWRDAINSGLLPDTATWKEWFAWARERGIRVAVTKNGATAYEVGNPNHPNLF
jgi:hypothetical protein